MDFLIALLSGILGGVAGGILLIRFRGRNNSRLVGTVKRPLRSHKSVAAFNDFLEKNAGVKDDGLE